MILSHNVNHSLFDYGSVPHVCDIALRGGCTSYVAQLKFETLFCDYLGEFVECFCLQCTLLPVSHCSSATVKGGRNVSCYLSSLCDELCIGHS